MSAYPFDPADSTDPHKEGLESIKVQLEDMMHWPKLPEVLSLLADAVEQRADWYEKLPKEREHNGHMLDMSDSWGREIQYRRLVAKELRCLAEPRTVRSGRRPQS